MAMDDASTTTPAATLDGQGHVEDRSLRARKRARRSRAVWDQGPGGVMMPAPSAAAMLPHPIVPIAGNAAMLAPMMPSMLPLVPTPIVPVVASNSPRPRIYVGSISFEIDENALRSVFAPFGTIRSCTLPLNPETGKHRGYAFIEFEEDKSATTAIQVMNGFELLGRPLKVNVASAMPAAAQAGVAAAVPPAPAIPPTAAAAAAAAAAAIMNPAVLGYFPGVNAAATAAVAAATAAGAGSTITSSSMTSLHREDNLRISSHTQRTAIMEKLARTGRESKVVLLKNMVDVNEVDDTLQEEVRDECQRFGTVVDVKVHVSSAPASASTLVASPPVWIYVSFSTIAEATRALESLNGRFFGGRTVQAVFYSEVKFAAGIYQEE